MSNVWSEFNILQLPVIMYLSQMSPLAEYVGDVQFVWWTSCVLKKLLLLS